MNTRQKAYHFHMDKLAQERVVYLRAEIAAIRRENQIYLLKEDHGQLLGKANESRRRRLLEIQEELATLGMPEMWAQTRRTA